MAISQYVDKAGETKWKVYVCIQSQINPTVRVQKVKFNCPSEKHAQKVELNLTRQCQADVTKRENLGVRWSDIVNAWAEYLRKEGGVRLSETTRFDYISAVRSHTKDWMGRPAASISRLNVRECLTQLRENGGSQGLQKRMKGLIKQVFEFGIESGLIRGMAHSPTDGVPLDKPEEKKPEILTTGEIRKLLSESVRLKNPWYPVWALALLTGMRNGELYALLWTDVNFENKTISVNKAYNSRLKVTTGTKAGYWRTVPISAELSNLLLSLKAQGKDHTYVLPRYPYWSSGLQAEQLRQFCLGVGLPSIRFHALRACFATQLIQNGVAAIMVQKICGWRDLKTMQRYIRLAGIEVEGATESLKILPPTEEEIANKIVALFTQ